MKKKLKTWMWINFELYVTLDTKVTSDLVIAKNLILK